jgi:hypothetical protein
MQYRFIALSDCAAVMVNASTRLHRMASWMTVQKLEFQIKNCTHVDHWPPKQRQPPHGLLTALAKSAVKPFFL